jgi:hypothetical protein
VRSARLLLSQRRTLRVSLKERDKTVVVIVWRGRVDKLSRRTKTARKTVLPAFQNRLGQNEHLGHLDTLSRFRPPFSPFPTSRGTQRRETTPAVWATRIYSALARLECLPQSQQLHHLRTGKCVPTRTQQDMLSSGQSKSRWILAQRLFALQFL